MKFATVLFISTVLSGCATGAPQTEPAALAAAIPSGFRGIEWGAQLRDVRDKMTLVAKDQANLKNVDLYIRAGDKLNFGDAQLEFIQYAFFKGRFQAAFIKSKPVSDRQMINTFQASFGPGTQNNKFINRYLWDSSPATSIFLDCTGIGDSCTAVISSKRLDAEQRADDAAAASGAKKDF